MTAARWIGRRVGTLLVDKLAIIGGLTVFFAAGWFLIPRYPLRPPRTLPMTALDHAWPFFEPWVYAYLSIGLFNIAAPCLTTDRLRLHRHAQGFTAVTVAAFAVFLVFPVVTPAPVAQATTALYEMLLADTRLNSFPSLHAGYTVYGLLYWAEVLPEIPSRPARRLAAVAATAWAATLLLSVLFLKQHYLADLVAGAALGALAYAVAFRRPRPAPAEAPPTLARRREITP